MFMNPSSARDVGDALRNYQKLGGSMVKNQYTGQVFDPNNDSPMAASVNGVLWNTARTGFGNAYDPALLARRASFLDREMLTAL
jgi:hypothetical protein